MTRASWYDTWHPARLWEKLPDGVVRCRLSPRNCRIRPGERGFCHVRSNRDGQLVTLNYGKSVLATEEAIETEAVFHYSPGEKTLAMGNIGCMLSCDYCQNWKTSQAREVSDDDVHYYSPEEVVQLALMHGVRVISWTYNDPVVWHEFVTATAALAKRAGIISLFKSAFFITPEAIEELLPFVDIFSISLKSMDPRYYEKVTKGKLQPVLDGARQVYRAKKHLEISTLMVTNLSDNEETARAVADFVGEDLGPEVPLHFVRFHPDYKFINTIRTPIPRLERAREIALAMGIHNVYVGNVFGNEGANSFCRSCGSTLVLRYGLNARRVGLTPEGRCANCGELGNFTLLPGAGTASASSAMPSSELHLRRARFEWHGDVRSLHVQVKNEGLEEQEIFERRFGDPAAATQWTRRRLGPRESYRFALAKATPREVGVEIALPPSVESSLHEVFDRAHFPTVDLAAGSLNADVTPLPMYRARSLTWSGEVHGQVAEAARSSETARGDRNWRLLAGAQLVPGSDWAAFAGGNRPAQPTRQYDSFGARLTMRQGSSLSGPSSKRQYELARVRTTIIARVPGAAVVALGA